MYTTFKDHLQSELAGIEEAGLTKRERGISGPQKAEIITGGTFTPASRRDSMANIAALAFSVSKIVSIRSMSQPPSISPRAASP